MFVSFFPRPKLLFSSAAIWALFCVLFWYLLARDWGSTLSIGGFFGYGFPDALTGADEAATALLQEQYADPWQRVRQSRHHRAERRANDLGGNTAADAASTVTVQPESITSSTSRTGPAGI